MTYRDNMPTGPLYNGQGQQQQQNPQLQHPQPPYHQPHSQPIHQQYASSYTNGNQQYQHTQYNQSAYSQQQPPSYYPNSTPQFTSYDANSSYNRPPPPSGPPVQFVDPSFLQRAPPVQTTYVPLPPAPASAPAPAPAPAVRPTLPALVSAPVSKPVLAPVQTQSPIIASQPLRPPQQSNTGSAKNSPRLDERRPPSQGGLGKAATKDARRLTSGGAVAKSPIMAGSPHTDSIPLVLCVAEDCFSKANEAIQGIAKTMTPEEVAEHHRLIATGLGCLEVAMKSSKLWPRLEARVCLRYASILVNETVNIMEAETALTKGIAVCDKHRFLDLKYSSQFILMKTLFQRSQKAAFKSIDAHIADCTTYKHIHWVYAFRFLKASFHLEAGSVAEHHAFENLRKIAATANQRGDKAIFVMATLLEGLAHLTSKRDDWVTRVQSCIAQAAKLQLDESVHLPQMDIMLLLLDLACSVHQKSQTSSQKLNALQTRLEELRMSRDWIPISSELLLPIKRSPNAASTISQDTRAVLRPGDDERDYLVLTTLGKQEAYGLAYVLHGIVALHRATTPGRSSSIWMEAVRILEEFKPVSTLQSLPEALKQAEWTKELVCYAHILTGLQSATLSDWAKVKECLQLIKAAQPPGGFLDIMILYLSGVFKQGTAQLVEATAIWKDARFAVNRNGELKPSSNHVEYELSILAALNRLWIMHEPGNRDDAEMADIIEQLRPLCEDNPDPEIRMAYNLVLASTTMSPPWALGIQQVKRHIQQSLGGAQSTNNTQCLSIALNIMRCRLFENVVGEQAVKSAKAGLAQAKKSGNLLWMCVAEGMLAQSQEMQGSLAEARISRDQGIQLANEAYQRTQV